MSRIHVWRAETLAVAGGWKMAYAVGCLGGFLGGASLFAGAVPSGVIRPEVGVVDLSGRAVNPFARSKAPAIVLLFVSVDCPISNSYAPEVQRLQKEFGPHGVIFRLVYPNPDETADAIRRHLREYGYAEEAWRDPRHELVKAAKVKVTPEAAVFTGNGVLVYHGRIDDRWVDFGKARPAAQVRDLRNVLQAVLAGKPVARSVTRPIGCYIPDAS